MTRKILMTFVVGAALSFQASAQKSSTNNLKINAKPKNMWELGINVGHTAITGDLDPQSNFGVGLHVRKALDYIFSIRVDANYYGFRGEEKDDVRPQDGYLWAYRYLNAGNSNAGAFGADWNPKYKTRVFSGEASVVVSLNNLVTRRKGKVNVYAFVGAGLSNLKVLAIDDTNNIEFDITKHGYDDGWSISPSTVAGGGIGFKLTDKISLGLEHKVMTFFGRGSDLLDAAERFGSAFTPSSDIAHYTNIRLGFALGDKNKKSLPLWWASPLDELSEDISEVKARPVLDLTDTDEDGVIDMLDKEENTEKGCPVNTRGEALDSDGDGIADCKDDEPYSPPGFEVDGKGIAVVPAEPEPLSEGDVNKLIDAKLSTFNPRVPEPMDWFLPMIHFDNNKYAIRGTEYGKLHNVATVMKQNPGLRVAVLGYTDKVAGQCYNDVLSYNRANAAIDYLVAKYGISRDRFLLNWGGENDSLVSTNGSNMMNRRVEFKIATSESEMGRPDCGVNNAGSGGKKYSGNKEAGY